MDVNTDDDWELSSPLSLSSEPESDDMDVDVDTWCSSDEDVEMVDMTSDSSVLINNWVFPSRVVSGLVHGQALAPLIPIGNRQFFRGMVTSFHTIKDRSNIAL